LSPCQHCSCS